MHPADAVDGYEPPWSSFASFFTARSDDAATYLIELDHELDTRREWTVGGWKLLVARVAEALRDLGIAPGDSVAALLGNRSEALVMAYACWTLGAYSLGAVAVERWPPHDSSAPQGPATPENSGVRRRPGTVLQVTHMGNQAGRTAPADRSRGEGSR